MSKKPIIGKIYKIVNSINDKIYIGQTINSLQKRWTAHKSDSKKEDYCLYRAMRKHGIENFNVALLIDNVSSKSELNYLESYYIAFFDSYRTGYNENYGSKDTSQLIKYRHKSIFGGQNRTQVLDFESGVFYQSITEAAKSRNIGIAKMLHKLSGRTYNNTSLIFLDEYEIFGLSKYKEKNLRFVNSKINTIKILSENSQKIRKKVLCINTNTIFPSLLEASKALNIPASPITAVCKGKLKHYKQYKFQYA